MSRFEDRLLDELMERYGALLAQAPPLAIGLERPLRRARARRAPLVAVSAALAGILVAVVVLVSSGGGPAPAYAITRNPDGTVTLTIRELAAAQAADRQLIAMGLPIRAVVAEAGCRVAPGTYRVAPPSGQSPPIRPFLSSEGVGLNIDPRKIPPGDTLVVGVYEEQRSVILTGDLYRGAIPPCLPSPTGP